MRPFLSAGPFTAANGEGRQLYREVSVELGEGELAVLEGSSGSGKSTLLRQLVGMVPTDGVTRMLGGESFEPNQLPRWRSAVTLAAQDAPMLAGSVEDNLAFAFRQRCAGRRRPPPEEHRSILASVGLGEIPGDRDVATLSGGERHRLALARALLWDPPVLLADEPLSGLDEDAAEACFNLLRGFAHRSGHAALCVFHERIFADRTDRRIALSGARRRVPA